MTPHWSDAQDRILLGVAEPEDFEAVERQRIQDRRKAAQELLTLAAILILTVEIVGVMAICMKGASWLK